MPLENLERKSHKIINQITIDCCKINYINYTFRRLISNKVEVSSTKFRSDN